jgi:superfamily II DNA or RNA helicase
MSKSDIDLIKNAKTYIGKRGYIIRKKFLSEKEITDIKNDLTVKPHSSGDYGKAEEPFKIYLENQSKLYMPKCYGIEKFGNPEQNIIPQGKDINISFSLQLKEEQKIPAQHTIDAYHKTGGGILSLPCGFGKTILALYFISVLKKKTIVVVHKEFLMNQWVERIQFALPTAKIGILQGDKCEIENSDIIIAMLQTLSMKEFPIDTFDDIGHVIIDECHRIPSRVFSKALLKINSQYMLGLSATPNRKDGLTKVLKWNIGDIIYSVKSNEKNIVKVERYLLDSTDENYNKEITSFRGQVQMPTMINNIANYYKRTHLIMEKVVNEIKSHNDRQFLILSDRKQHLEDMNKLANQMGITSVGYYIGGMKKDKLKASESCKILLGTYPMANEGLDIPSLNGLVLSTPKSDIIQSIGRICRMKHENIQPLIIDIVDKFSIFESQSRKRFNVYKKKKYEIEDIMYNLDNSIVTMNKNYFFHNCFNDNSSDSENSTINLNDEDDSKYEVDTEYKNIDPKTNKLNKNSKKIATSTTNKKKDDNINVENMFKQFSMFT